MIALSPEDRRLTALAFRIEAENIAFKMGHLTAMFERIAQQADELRMRRELAWARACVITPKIGDDND